MRISDYDHQAIKQTFAEVFGEGKVYLFGSRVDDSRRGGDIDLYLCPQKLVDEFKQKSQFSMRLQDRIGEQKIDIVIAKDQERLIEQEAMRTGILL